MMEFFERYAKHVIEEFALRVIAKSFDFKFSMYVSPTNTDNFDYVSKDGLKALEITAVIPKNEMAAYIYEKELSKGKKNLSIEKIKDAIFKEDGTLSIWYGGGISELKGAILMSIQKKHDKAIRRMENSSIRLVDLCICISDGSLYDLQTFKLLLAGLDKYIFENIFFVTPSYFIRYSRKTEFQEYTRCI